VLKGDRAMEPCLLDWALIGLDCEGVVIVLEGLKGSRLNMELDVASQHITMYRMP